MFTAQIQPLFSVEVTLDLYQQVVSGEEIRG